MKDTEYIAQLIELYKGNKITQFALEQELALFIGGQCEVRIHRDAYPTTVSTYGIFPLPEMHVSGLKVIFYIDERVIKNELYTPEEIIGKLVLIADMRQSYMREYFKFITTHKESTVSFCDALACLLRIYQSVAQYLRVEGRDFIPDDNALAGMIASCDNGEYCDENIEKLFINNIIPSEAAEAAKKMSHDNPEYQHVSITFSNEEKPSLNLAKQERRTFCDGTYDWMHKEIPYDYKPSTNQ